MSRRYVRLMLVGVMSWSLLLPHSAAARPAQGIGGFGCSVSSGDPWFVEALAFDPVTIAPGVLFEPTDPYKSNALAQLRNTSPISLYLVEFTSSTADSYTAAAPIVLAKNAFVRSQIVSDTVSVWTDNSTENKYEWQKYAGAHQIEIDRSPLEAVLAGYVDRQVYRDHRPLSLPAPRPKVYSLQVIYGTELISIPVTRTYTLNASYNPTRTQDEQAACSGWGRRLGVSLLKELLGYLFRAVIITIAIVLPLVWIVSWILKRSSR